jgi:hypothetical protein
VLRLVLLLLCLSSTAWAQSQVPPQIPEVQAQAGPNNPIEVQQQPKGANNNGPLTPASKSQAAPGTNGQQVSTGGEESGYYTADGKKPFVFGMTLSEALLALFTFLLFIVGALQICQLKRTNAHMSAIERARVFVIIQMEYIRPPTTGGHIEETICVRAILKNHGKTPAFLTEWRAYIVPTDVHLRKLPDVGQTGGLPEGVVIGAGQEHTIDLTDDLETFIPDYRDKRFLLCLGHIRYRDIFKKRRVTGFYWEQNVRFGTGTFVIAESALNYYT